MKSEDEESLHVARKMQEIRRITKKKKREKRRNICGPLNIGRKGREFQKVHDD